MRRRWQPWKLYRLFVSRDNQRMQSDATLFLVAPGQAFVLEVLLWLMAPGRVKSGFASC